MGRKIAFTFIVIFCILIAIAIVIPNFLGGRTRSKGSRAQADLRSLATGIESYYVDHRAYPAWSTNPEENAFASVAPGDRANFEKLPTFMLRNSRHPIDTLTTPVSYLTSYHSDVFGVAKNQPYCYWATGLDWILWSAGPDMKFDLTIENIEQAYDRADEKILGTYLLERTFDPTNGSVSGGDLWRARQ